MQNDINHYVTRDRINHASFRQKLDPISKNILRRQNPLELDFEDISTFDAENPIIGSFIRDLDVKKKILASDLMKGVPTRPGKDPEIQKRLDRLRDRQEPAPSDNLALHPSPPSFPPPLDRSYHPYHRHFSLHLQFLLHSNHHPLDQTIILEIFMFQYNFHQLVFQRKVHQVIFLVLKLLR